jgi:hypothetical protein
MSKESNHGASRRKMLVCESIATCVVALFLPDAGLVLARLSLSLFQATSVWKRQYQEDPPQRTNQDPREESFSVI